MLPGDYLALQLTGAATTSLSTLSEGIFWDFARHELSQEVLDYFEFDKKLIPPVQDVFSAHGQLRPDVAASWESRPAFP